MTKLTQIYKCSVCGNTTEVVHASSGELVCCGKPMILMEENTVDAATEKHVPVVEVDGNTVTVTVGEVEHPMEKEHYIELIQIIQDGRVIGSYEPMPGEKPIAVFLVENPEGITARELCNLHGLWKSL